MARNIEIKARVRDVARLRRAAERVATSGPDTLLQHDVFYAAASGRLKLRRFPDGRGELIHYHRPDDSGPRTSRYSIFRTDDGDGLAALLECALPVIGDVRKTRTLFLAGRTRIHLDDVAGLGAFVELEVVLDGADDPGTDEETAAGRAEAERLMTELGIGADDLVGYAYVDLLLDRAAQTKRTHR